MASWRTGGLQSEGFSAPPSPRFESLGGALKRSFVRSLLGTPCSHPSSCRRSCTKRETTMAFRRSLIFWLGNGDMSPSAAPGTRLLVQYVRNHIYCLLNCSIVNGFAVPIKKEHKQMLQKYLIPLHKVLCFPATKQSCSRSKLAFDPSRQLPEMRLHYAPQLSYCMTLFCGKDHTLTQTVGVWTCNWLSRVSVSWSLAHVRWHNSDRKRNTTILAVW